jgi:perosamine synthetase
MYRAIIDFIRELYGHPAFVPLHEPRFLGNEKAYVADAIDSTFVSSVGEYVNRFEAMLRDLTGISGAVATVNGTAALHAALVLAGVTRDDEVITQPVSFVATANAVAYCGARLVFLDVDRNTLGLSPDALTEFLSTCVDRRKNGAPYNRITGRRIGACVPMHTFGHPCEIDRIMALCDEYRIPLVEDAAESIGSTFRGRHTGTFGLCAALSFNGNKTLTCGGGGAILTNDAEFAKRAKHITTTAKVPHPYEYFHDAVAFNYRLPNLNAALACAQMEQLDTFLTAKRRLATMYAAFFERLNLPFVHEPPHARSNYWLNAVLLPNRVERDAFLEETNKNGVMTRPLWNLLNALPMFQSAQTDALANAQWLADRLVNIPSSVPNTFLNKTIAGPSAGRATPAA